MADGDGAQGKKNASSLIKDALSQKNVWLLGLFFFFYLGVVITAGGWVVEYLVDVRNGDIAQMGYVPAGFSGVIGAHAGVAVMQPILVGLIVAMTISWLLVPQPKGKMT
ncbi:hypothetical protein NEMBOFW57_005710 [Staphylotrichum longicolle]|uniref:Uncharacterized protein n=1 Tax=Staphylotrichum longicolle TaxID=669026 RepID=A0AAD4F1Y8_9PEZI|nr:hypothetical protein NEMBOFW57_005710 [Staphylotrichum longicolle]